MILIGLGANLPGPDGAAPRENLEKALASLSQEGVKVIATSPFYKSEPVPKSDQPWFVNGVALVETALSPEDLLHLLHSVEADIGRTRRIRNEARIIDLDLLDYQGRVLSGARGGLALPHPRLHQRRFVLKPLTDLAPGWQHPVFRKTAAALLEEVSGPGRMVPL